MKEEVKKILLQKSNSLQQLEKQKMKILLPRIKLERKEESRLAAVNDGGVGHSTSSADHPKY